MWVLENTILSEILWSKNGAAGYCTRRSFVIHPSHQMFLEWPD